tara:strand:- start:16 stop:1134 length:1119 start_codon:yes stop_codon:yes gene_type:complete
MAHQIVNLETLTDILPIVYSADVIQPIVVIGMTGGGKSQFCKTVMRKAFAESKGLTADDIGFITERMAGRDAEVFSGASLPFKGEDGSLAMQSTKPPLILAIERLGTKYTMVLLDELLQANADCQKVCSDMLDPDEHSIGGWALPKGTIVVATGNRTKDKSGANRLLAHLTDRVAMFELKFSIDTWAEWAYANGVNPIVIECAKAYSDEGFFADSVPATDEQYCSPRSLTRASSHLNAFFKMKGNDAYLNGTIRALIAANIGDGATTMLFQYAEIRDQVPTEADIQRNPETALVPDITGHQMIAGHNAIASATDGDSIGQAFKYILRLRTDLQVSMNVRLLKIAGNNGWVSNEPLVNQFLAKYHDLITLGVS